MQVISKAKNGSLLLESEELRKFLLKHEGREILVSFEEFGKEKSGEQLGYFWSGVVGALVDLGWSKRDAEIYLKKNCGYVEEWYNEKEHRKEYILVSIADMNMKELSAFIDSCIKHLGEQGVDVPSPSQYWASKRIRQ